MHSTRRSFLAAAAVTAAFSGFARRSLAQPLGAPDYRSQVAGYGPLRPDPAGLFDLPEGFAYRIVSQAGRPMSDGFVTPRKADGMACFSLDEHRVVLVRNHELKSTDLEYGAFGPGRALADRMPRDRLYDLHEDGLPLVGGTTSLVWDLKAQSLVSDHVSLAGTVVNCAGGATPWGSWLSCEETLQSAGQEVRKDHGWVFEVPSGLRGVADPQPIKGMGRFRHEAAAIDPATGIAYLTEDMGDGFGLFYRYLPRDRRNLHAGGRLQALALPEGADADPRNWETPYWRRGDWRNVRWVDLDGVDNPYEDLRYRGHAAGAAWFARGEGVFFGQGELFFCCTSGGPGGGGQVMRYVPSPEEGQPGEADRPGRLQLFVEAADPQLLEMPDNVAVAPWGHLYICEDKAAGHNALRGVTPRGEVYTVGRNAAPPPESAPVNSERAGVCFSPDGSTCFVNLYSPGTTLAITGPWARFDARSA
ncbi:MAG: alkaline phosphatase PhoX [Phenylobacterium sp.]